MSKCKTLQLYCQRKQALILHTGEEQTHHKHPAQHQHPDVEMSFLCLGI